MPSASMRLMLRYPEHLQFAGDQSMPLATNYLQVDLQRSSGHRAQATLFDNVAFLET